VYAYYTRTGDVLVNVLHDAPRVPALEEAVAGHEHWLDGVVATLETGWKARGGKRDASLPVMLLEHAAMLSTWRSLGRAGLDERGAARFIERCMRGLVKR
jgi:hypothetical protein